MGNRFKGPGGTPGGEGSFLLGLLLAVAGGYLILNQVQVSSGGMVLFGMFGMGGMSSFGLTLVPLILGLGVMFFDARSILGWALVGVGAVIIFAGILANLHIYIRQTTLYNFLLMLTLFAGGIGLMARGLFRSR